MNCPECGDNDTVVTRDKFTVCRECGCVLDDESKYTGLSFNPFMSSEPITMPVDINFTKRKYSLNKLNQIASGKKVTIHRVYATAWHEITRILAIFNMVHLTPSIFTRFKRIFNSFLPNSPNRQPYILSPVAILQIFQEMDINVTMSEIAEHIDCGYRKLKSVYNHVISAGNYVTTDVRVRKHIEQYSHLTIITGRIIAGAIELYIRYGSMMSNRRPSTVASVCVILSYYMQTQFDEIISKNQLCKKMNMFPMLIVPILRQFGAFFFNEPLWVDMCPRLLDSSVKFIPKTHNMYTEVMGHV